MDAAHCVVYVHLVRGIGVGGGCSHTHNLVTTHVQVLSLSADRPQRCEAGDIALQLCIKLRLDGAGDTVQVVELHIRHIATADLRGVDRGTCLDVRVVDVAQHVACAIGVEGLVRQCHSRGRNAVELCLNVACGTVQVIELRVAHITATDLVGVDACAQVRVRNGRALPHARADGADRRQRVQARQVGVVVQVCRQAAEQCLACGTRRVVVHQHRIGIREGSSHLRCIIHIHGKCRTTLRQCRTRLYDVGLELSERHIAVAALVVHHKGRRYRCTPLRVGVRAAQHQHQRTLKLRRRRHVVRSRQHPRRACIALRRQLVEAVGPCVILARHQHVLPIRRRNTVRSRKGTVAACGQRQRAVVVGSTQVRRHHRLGGTLAVDAAHGGTDRNIHVALGGGIVGTRGHTQAHDLVAAHVQVLGLRTDCTQRRQASDIALQLRIELCLDGAGDTVQVAKLGVAHIPAANLRGVDGGTRLDVVVFQVRDGVVVGIQRLVRVRGGRTGETIDLVLHVARDGAQVLELRVGHRAVGKLRGVDTRTRLDVVVLQVRDGVVVRVNGLVRVRGGVAGNVIQLVLHRAGDA